MHPLNPLKNNKIGIIGFNARPLACSVKKLGADVFVSDYWGDDDLTAWCHEWIAVLSPQPGDRQRKHLDKPIPLVLADNFLTKFSEIDFDIVLVGSGFDDCSEILVPIEKKWGITGNSSRIMKSARDTERIKELAVDAGFRSPKTKRIYTVEQGKSFIDTLGYPYVLRPVSSGGGSGIRIILNEAQLEEKLAARDLSKGVVLQQYVSGLDYSLSLLCNGTNSFSLSVQGQLIGLPSAGRNSDFVYCGNYYPSGLSNSIENNLREGCEAIGNSLQLIGSNGFDFVIGPDESIWLMEINPRIQGTLEMLEFAGDTSVSFLHIDATKGNLPTHNVEFSPSMKMIVYANRQGLVPDLSKYPNTVDRSPTGVLVERGDPICSVIEKGSSLIEIYSKVTSTSNEIRYALKNKGYQ